jgi:hypothetical protein
MVQNLSHTLFLKGKLLIGIKINVYEEDFAFACIPGLIGLQVVLAQTRDITGTVTSTEDGSTVPGASVVVKGYHCWYRYRYGR